MSDGDLEAASRCFARDACFVTPDSTVVQGRGEIRPILAQLISMNLRLRTELHNVLVVGDVALSSEPLTMRFEPRDRPASIQSKPATIVLGRVERDWKLLFAALWGWS